MTVVDRFICRREGHEPAVKFANIKSNPPGVVISVVTTCVRCGVQFEHEVSEELQTR